MTKKHLKLTDISKEGDVQLDEVNIDELIPLPPPYDKNEGLKQLTDDQKVRLVNNLDGFSALALPKPKDKAEENKYIGQFVAGLKKL